MYVRDGPLVHIILPPVNFYCNYTLLIVTKKILIYILIQVGTKNMIVFTLKFKYIPGIDVHAYLKTYKDMKLYYGLLVFNQGID